jgi:RNA polymerase sigma-70 factor (ECF subfamily)
MEKVFLLHHARVLRAAYQITGSMADAEDVAQTVFLRYASTTAGQHVKNADSYFYRAAINAALDVLRRRRHENLVAIDEAHFVQASALRLDSPECEMRDWIRKALATLSPKAAEMFVLRYVEGLDLGEVARVLGTSRAVVAVTLHRTRARLRSDYEAHLRGTR